MEVEAAVLPPPKVKPEEVVAVEVGALPKMEPVAGAVLPNIDPAAGAAVDAPNPPKVGFGAPNIVLIVRRILHRSFTRYAYKICSCEFPLEEIRISSTGIIPLSNVLTQTEL